MTPKNRSGPIASAYALIVEDMVIRALSLTWATICLWDYPNLPREQQPSARNAPPRPG